MQNQVPMLRTGLVNNDRSELRGHRVTSVTASRKEGASANPKCVVSTRRGGLRLAEAFSQLKKQISILPDAGFAEASEEQSLSTGNRIDHLRRRLCVLRRPLHVGRLIICRIQRRTASEAETAICEDGASIVNVD